VRWIRGQITSKTIADLPANDPLDLSCDGVSKETFEIFRQWCDPKCDGEQGPSIAVDPYQFMELTKFAQKFEVNRDIYKQLDDPKFFTITDPDKLVLLQLRELNDQSDPSERSILISKVREKLNAALSDEVFLDVPIEIVVEILSDKGCREGMPVDLFANYLIRAIDKQLPVEPLFAYVDWLKLSLETAEPLMERAERGQYRTIVTLDTVLRLQGRLQAEAKKTRDLIDQIRQNPALRLA
jgi:hypothetical protein